MVAHVANQMWRGPGMIVPWTCASASARTCTASHPVVRCGWPDWIGRRRRWASTGTPTVTSCCTRSATRCSRRQVCGDLGSNFGSSEPEWAGAAGHDLLAETLQRVRSAGWEVGNVACQLIGNRPTFAPRRLEAERGVRVRHGIDVSITATTTDGLGLTGRGEGLAAIATSLLTRAPESED